MKALTGNVSHTALWSGSLRQCPVGVQSKVGSYSFLSDGRCPMPSVEATPRIAIKNILFPTDFSERSAAALPYAAVIARRYGAKVYLAHVVAEPLVPTPAIPAPRRMMAQQEMAILDRSDLLNGIPYEAVVEQGEVWEVLADLIRQREIDLIVLGTHGREGLTHILSESVAEDIVRDAMCPVLAVGPEVPARAQCLAGMTHILFATDLRPASPAPWRYALSFAEEDRSRLTMIHAVDPHAAPMSEEQRESAFCQLQQALRADTDLLPGPEFVLRVGPPADVILNFAAERNSDLVVMGAHEPPPGAPAGTFAWPVLYRVLCQAHCPLLIVPD